MITEIYRLVVIGTSYKISSLLEREKLQINRKEMPGALESIKSVKDVDGVVIVSTCNRLEFYLVLCTEIDPYSLIRNFYEKKGISAEHLRKELFYSACGADVAKHLFRVAAGLDSMLLGEYQVQGQLKDAYSIACSNNTADKILHKLFHNAFRAGKAVRTKTTISSYNQSLSSIAFKIIKEKLKKEDLITIVGVNESTKILADKLNKAGYIHLMFANRKLYKAEELAEKYRGVAYSLDCIEEPLMISKCVFSCTGAPGYILSSETINRIYSRNTNPKLLIDMAVPRDIETEGLIKDIEVIDMEELKKYLNGEKKKTVLELPEAEKIISDEVGIFNAWNESQSDESLCFIQERLETLRLQLLNEKRQQISDSELQMLDKFSRSMVHRMKSIIAQAAKTTSE